MAPVLFVTSSAAQGFYAGLLFGFTNLSIFCAYALAMWYGGERIIHGSYTPGNIITIIGLALLGGSTAGQVRQSFPIRFFAGED